MLCRIGTRSEFTMLGCRLPKSVSDELLYYVSVLDSEYGAERDYLNIGGYILIAENCDDVCEMKAVIDYDSRLCEWASVIGDGYLSAMYLLDNEFAIVVFMPIDVAPKVLLEEFKGED